MHQRLVGFALAALATACAGEALIPAGPCDSDEPDPACAQACSVGAADGSTGGCPAGFYCSSAGTCGAECNPGETCADGGVCASDGRCGIADEFDPEVCPAVELVTTRVIPAIELLIDQSGSMSREFGGDSRYDAVEDALVATGGDEGVVTRFENAAYFGASLYTSGSTCPRIRQTSSGRALGNRAAIADLIGDNGPASETPTGEAIERAIEDFEDAPPPAGSPRVILLATDGEPDVCSDGDDETAGRARSVAAAQAAFAAGIHLYVLSVGNDTAETHLQKVANAGAGLDVNTGTAEFFVADDADELATQLATIVGDVVSCDLDLSASVDPTRAAAGLVELDGSALEYGVDWELVDDDTLRLLGGACETLQQAASATVTASFPCGVVIE